MILGLSTVPTDKKADCDKGTCLLGTEKRHVPQLTSCTGQSWSNPINQILYLGPDSKATEVSGETH